MRKKERRKEGVGEFHSLQISATLFTVDNNVAVCCIEMLRSFGRALSQSFDTVLSIAFVVVVVSVAMQGTFPVLFVKKHLS